MTEQSEARDQLISELVDICQRAAEIGATILLGDQTADTLEEPESIRARSKVCSLPWWAERAMRLKSLDVGDISALSPDDIQRLIRELQVHQVEVKMKNEELTRVHHELRDSRDRYSDLYDFAPVGYFTLNNDLMILEVNRTGAAMLGTSTEALLHKPFSAFVCKDDYGSYYSHFRQVLGTKTRRTCEIMLERCDGARFCGLFESVPVQDPEGRFTRCRTVISDISDLKRVEEALRESEELHRVTLSSISDTVLITDNKGFFTYVCPNVDVIFGYSQAEVKSLQQVDRLLGAGFFDPALLDGHDEVANIERRIEDKDGDEHVLLVNVKRVSIKGGTCLFSCRDITALKKAQEALENTRYPT